jgi:DNA-binding HxlR family transcriptional regulator
MQVSRPRTDCPLDAIMSIIEGRWKPVIICNLAIKGPMRFNQMRDAIPRISSRMLSLQLKEMEADFIVKKSDRGDGFSTYALTSRGESLAPVLKSMAEWGLCNMFPNMVRFDDTIIMPAVR